MRRVIFLFAVFSLLSLPGCVRDVPEIAPDPALDTIPYYPPGVYGFSTPEALDAARRRKEEEERKKQEFAAEIQKRIAAAGTDEFIDPWAPPATRPASDLPEAIRGLPMDAYGYPDWAASAEGGLIKPRGALTGKEVEELLDLDIVFEIKDVFMADVMFSHRAHTRWLSCANCHPGIFREKKGANRFTMSDVWKGEFCGRCHGKVAFQPKGFENCQRCHSAGKRR
jgi:c(7)-type cytochrome triheme protein